jgi:hypothetical protein
MTAASFDDLVGAGEELLRKPHPGTVPAAGVLRGGRANGVDQIEATLDAVEPAVDVVEPFLNGCIIQLDAGDLALERAKPRHNFVELATDVVETIVEPRETSAQKVENIAGLAHA